MQRRKKHHHDWKYHLSNLPDIDDFPDWQGSGKFACLLIPIFSFDESGEHILNYVAKASAWALKTWKENTDAHLFNIPCYIYVESTIAGFAIPILRENNIPDDHIIVADYTNTERLAKCLQPIFDESLEDYEYIVIADVDIFAVKSEDDYPKKLPFFENIRNDRPDGIGCKICNDKTPYYWIPHFANLAKYKERPVHGDIVDAWFRQLSDLTSRNDLRKYYDGGETNKRPWTAVMVINNKNAFDAKSKKFLEKSAKILGDDEAVLYSLMYSKEKNEFWDLDEIKITLFMDFIDYIHAAYDKLLKETNINDVVFEHVFVDKPFLIHHYASYDYKFMKVLGVVK